MNPLDLQEMVKRFLQWDIDRIASLITGLLIGAAFGWWLLRHLRTQAKELREENIKLKEWGSELFDRMLDLQETVAKLTATLKKVEPQVEPVVAEELEKARQEIEEQNKEQTVKSAQAAVAPVPHKLQQDVERRRCDKPVLMRWNDESKQEQAVSSWKEVLVESTKKALALGLSRSSLPMRQGGDRSSFNSPREVQPNLYIETNASADQIRQWVSRMLQERCKTKSFLQIVTRAGITIELP